MTRFPPQIWTLVLLVALSNVCRAVPAWTSTHYQGIRSPESTTTGYAGFSAAGKCSGGNVYATSCPASPGVFQFTGDLLYFVPSYDVETQESWLYNCNTSCSDGTTTVYTLVDLTIYDMNDNVPYFLPDLPLNIAISDNTPAARITTAKAGDDDINTYTNSRLTYFIPTENNPNADKFIITSSGKVLVGHEPLTWEPGETKTLVVAVRDNPLSGEPTYTGTVTYTFGEVITTTTPPTTQPGDTAAPEDSTTFNPDATTTTTTTTTAPVGPTTLFLITNTPYAGDTTSTAAATTEGPCETGLSCNGELWVALLGVLFLFVIMIVACICVIASKWNDGQPDKVYPTRFGFNTYD